MCTVRSYGFRLQSPELQLNLGSLRSLSLSDKSFILAFPAHCISCKYPVCPSCNVAISEQASRLVYHSPSFSFATYVCNIRRQLGRCRVCRWRQCSSSCWDCYWFEIDPCSPGIYLCYGAYLFSKPRASFQCNSLICISFPIPGHSGSLGLARLLEEFV